MTVGKNRPKISETLRKAVFKKDNGCCHYCGCRLSVRTFKADHVHPFSKNGRTNYTNLVATCTFCNSVKSNLSVMQFRQRLKDIAESTKELGQTVRNKYNLAEGEDIEFYFEREAEPQCTIFA